MEQYENILNEIHSYKLGKDKINISDLAKLMNLTAESLRKYDKQGIIVPIRDDNSYRIYSSWEITKIIRTRQLRNEGVSLKDINKLFTEATMEDSMSYIDHRRCELKREIEEKKRLLEWLDNRKEMLLKYESHTETAWRQKEEKIYCCIYMVYNTMVPKAGKKLKQLQEWMDALPYLSVYYVGSNEKDTVSCVGFTESERLRFHLEHLEPDFILQEADYIVTKDAAKHTQSIDTSYDVIDQARKKAQSFEHNLEDIYVIKMIDYVQRNGEYASVNQIMIPVKK